MSTVWSLRRHTDWGLRKYSGNMAHVWGGDADGCVHEWGDEIIAKANDSNRGTMEWTTGGNPATKVMGTRPSQGQFCLRCGAWYGELGLEPNPELYCQNMVAVFREVRRVLHPSGTVWLNLGDSYAGSWGNYHPTGTGGQRNKDTERFDRKAYADKNFLPPTASAPGLKPKDLVGIPWRVAFALQADGWWLRSAPPWIKNNPMPESCQDRPTTAHEYWFILTKKAHYYSDADAVRGGNKREWGDNNIGVNNRINTGVMTGIVLGRDKDPHCGLANTKPNPAGRNRRTSDFFYESLDHMIEQESSYLRHLKKVRSEGGMLLDQDDMPIALIFNTYAFKGSHFATFSPKMIEPIIKFSTSERGCCPECGGQWVRVVEKSRHATRPAIENKYEAGHYNNERFLTETTTLGWRPTCDCPEHEPIACTVFDPFVGSGTSLQVARQLGRNGVGIDLSAEYLQLARKRLSLDKLDAWNENGITGTSVLDDLPMFGGNDAEKD